MDSAVSHGGQPARHPSASSRISLVWKAAVSAVTLAGGLLAIWHQLPPRTTPHATIARITLGDRLTHAQYLRSAEFTNVADQAHDRTAPYLPGAPGSVFYYSIDIAGHGFYHVRYQLWDKNHNLKTKAPVEVRALYVRKEEAEQQAFWVPALSDVATVHLYVAPDNPPPLIFDWKDQAWNGI